MMDLIQAFRQYQANYIVYPKEIESIHLIKNLKKQGFRCLPAIDPRSAVYIATGIAAQNHELVVCIVNSSNASRSVFSGMTEAYYRKLPIVLITIGTELDYSTELGDVVQNHCIISETDDMTEILNTEYPIHLELQTNCFEVVKAECSELQRVLCRILDKEHYLLIGTGIDSIDTEFKCKTVNGGMPNCNEGGIANVLGASLAKIRKRYIGLLSENEFVHDINTIGNINVNDRLLFIIVTDIFNQTIEEYSRCLGFETLYIERGKESDKALISAVNNMRKTVIQYIGEK